MQNKEYLEALKSLKDEYEAKEKDLMLRYARGLVEKSGLNIGDTIGDDNKVIRIQKFVYSNMGSVLPIFYCKGVWLTKQGKDNAKGEEYSIFPERIKTHNGMTYILPED